MASWGQDDFRGCHSRGRGGGFVVGKVESMKIPFHA